MFTSGNKDTNYGIDPFSNLFYIPSPLYPPYNRVLMELEGQGLLLQEEHENGVFQPMENSACDESISAGTILNMVDSAEKHHHQAVYHELIRSNEEAQVVRRRSSKRDRHSKINTARGPRDRRMRLSLKVARQFFDVQDMLGFDKGSKTLEWLLIQSKPSIEKLLAGVPSQMTMNYCWKSVSSPSECEVISGLDEAGLIAGFSPKGTSKTSSSKIKKVRRTRSSISSGRILQKPLARESRARARARARERTSEKKKLSEEASNRWSNPNLLGSCWSSAFRTGEDQYSSSPKQAFNHHMNHRPLPHPPPSSDVLGKADERIREKQGRLEAATGCFINDSLVIMSKWNPSSIPMSHLQRTSNIPHEFTDFQSMCKNW